MVRLSDIEIGTKDVVVALLSAAAGYYMRKPIEEKKREEKLRDAELFGRTAAQYLAEEMKNRGAIGPETYKAIDELTATLKDVKEELKNYRAEK